MTSSKIPDALGAVDAFLTAMCMGHVPSCFTPKNETAALGINAALSIIRLFGRAKVAFGPTSKLAELRDMVQAARAELEPPATEPTSKDVPS